MKVPESPNAEWYWRISKDRGVTPRCPYATVERCPRYYHSLSLLSKVGSTKISAAEEARLTAFWEKSDLLPRTKEQATTVSSTDAKWSSLTEFCPEVTYDRFGFFAKGLGNYPDSIDRDIACQRLEREGVAISHWQWQWAWLTPLHFTECPLYSPLSLSAPEASKTEARREEPITLRPTFMGMSVNLNEVWRRLSKRLWGQKE